MSEKEKKRQVIPVAGEELKIDKRRRDTGGVRVQKSVHEREQVIDEPLLDTDVEVRRVPKDEIVDEPVGTRQRGDTTIIPVYEEVVVTEKRLLLKEEVHVTRKQVERRRPKTVILRQEEVQVTSLDESSDNQDTQHPQR